MKKYQTMSYSLEIQEIKVVKETEKQVIVEYERVFDGKKATRRENKETEWRQIHNSRKEAAEYLLKRTNKKIEHHLNELDKYKNEKRIIEDLVKKFSQEDE